MFSAVNLDVMLDDDWLQGTSSIAAFLVALK